MTPRERVLAAIRGDPTDRVPVMYWLNPHAACRLLAEYQPGRSRVATALARALWRRFTRQGGLDAGRWTRVAPLLLEEYGNGSYVLELGADIAILSPETISPPSFITSIRKEGGRLSVRGVLGGRMALGGIYMDPVDPPAKRIEDLAAVTLPEVAARHFGAIGAFRRRHPEACLFVEVGSFQQLLCDYVMGTERFMLALYDHPREVRSFLERLAEWVLGFIRHAAIAGADAAYLQDDYGASGRPLISLKMWREFTYPHLRRMVEVAHAAGLPFVLHSCGYQIPFLEDYVEAGVDALQSFQPKAGNGFAGAYERFGDRLTFATGIDVQQGERMTPEELRTDILRSVEIGRTKRRHVLAMTHMMQYTMPAPNVHAIFDTIRGMS